MRGLMIAAPRSGSGKTTITLGLIAALRARGIDVRAAKCGPDYIDPAFHRAATGTGSVNLDSWAMEGAMLDALAHDNACELLVVEAAMGLFDGAGRPGPGGADGSAASIARRLNLGVVLVLDVSGQAQSAAAVASGFARHADGVSIVGVVLNQVASPRHAARAGDAIAACGIPVLGAIGRDARAGLPARHLGLVQASEHPALAAHLAHLADLVERGCNVDAIITSARPIADRAGAAHGTGALPPPGQRIAIARDAAFAFAYPHMLDFWHALGAAIIPFSPLADEAPAEDCDAVWLPGGYPELHAGRLAANTCFMNGIREAAARGRAMHGECGGYMVMGQGLTDADGIRHAMAGLLDHDTSFAERRLHLGYRAASLLADCALGREGDVITGHEFHYATLSRHGADAPLARLTDAEGQPIGAAGGVRGRVSGGFFHAIAQARTSSEGPSP